MSKERVFPITTYAVQSRGPVPSGLMLDSGPALLASYLDNSGYRPVVFDFNNIDTVEKIEKHGKNGFLAETIDFLDDYYRSNDVKIAGAKLYANGFSDSVMIHEELKKRNPGMLLVAGGPQVDWFGERIFEYTDAFDVLSYGDGDEAVSMLADLAYGNGRIEDIPNIIYKSGSATKRNRRKDIDMSGIPAPSYSEEFYPNIDGKVMIAPREDSRGCRHGKCSFCVHTRIGGHYRTRPVEELAYEMSSSGMITHRLSGPSPSPDYISELIKHAPGTKISAFGYSDSAYDYDDISDNLLGIFIGLESTDRNILEDVLRKTRDAASYLSKAREMVKEFRKRGVATIVSMMVPSPGETTKTMERSLEYLADMNPDFVVALPMGPIPGTAMTIKAKKDPHDAGILLENDFEDSLMSYELDLLQRPDEWAAPPFRTLVDGEFSNPFRYTMKFTASLMKEGIYPLSDEIVLMSSLYNNGLSRDQEERRKQCNGFMKMIREDIASGNASSLRETVERMNSNQRRKI